MAIKAGPHYIKVSIPVCVTDDDIEEILSLGLRGIGAWGEVDAFWTDDPARAAIALLDGSNIAIIEKAGKLPRAIFLSSLLRGIQQFVDEEDNGGLYVEEGRLMTECLDEFSGNYIIQYAAYGRIMYDGAQEECP